MIEEPLLWVVEPASCVVQPTDESGKLSPDDNDDDSSHGSYDIINEWVW